ncbi:MAG: hypothetical protein HQ522_16660 [Bacteroidetes bacterium]|nr:hypothetical protein [Bacteroidota bacterium]
MKVVHRNPQLKVKSTNERFTRYFETHKKSVNFLVGQITDHFAGKPSDPEAIVSMANSVNILVNSIGELPYYPEEFNKMAKAK